MNDCIKNISDLIAVYDAANELRQLSYRLNGFTVDSKSILSELLKVTDVLNRISPLHDPKLDWEDSPVKHILDNRSLTSEERARRLMPI